MQILETCKLLRKRRKYMNEKKMAEIFVTYQLLKRGSSELITYAAISSEEANALATKE